MIARLAVAVSLPLCLTTAALAAPQFVRVSWTNPDDTGTTAAISWNTPESSAPTTVEYGTTAAYGMSATGATTATGGPVGDVHVVELTGLTPLTTYHYRVGGPGDWSPDYTFTTGPPADDPGCEPIRIIAMGDGRSDDGYGPATHWKSILTEAVDRSPTAIVLTGDQVKDGDDHQQWLHWLEDSEGPMASVPVMPSLGNHDDDSVEGDNAIYNKVFSVPANADSGTEDYYYFTIGNAIFVSLSSQTYQGGASPMADQAAWLDQVLTDNPKTWKFVYFHHPPYTGVLGLPGLLELNHPPNEKNQNAALVPIFDKHHVDIVFTGHNHHYQRFEPLCCGGSGDEGTPTGDPETGTTYVVTGGAGALTYDLSFLGIDLPALLCLTPGSASCDGRHHYVQVDIDGLELTYRVYTTASQLLSNDVGNIELVDEFTISKSGTPPECNVVADPGPDAAPDGPADEAEAQAEAAPEAAEEVVDEEVAGPEQVAEAAVEQPAAEPTPEAGPEAGPEPGPEPAAEAAPDEAPGEDADAAADAPADATAGDDAQNPQVDGTNTPIAEPDLGGGGTGGDTSSGCASGHGSPVLPTALIVALGMLAIAVRRRARP